MWLSAISKCGGCEVALSPGQGNSERRIQDDLIRSLLPSVSLVHGLPERTLALYRLLSACSGIATQSPVKPSDGSMYRTHTPNSPAKKINCLRMYIQEGGEQFIASV